MLTLLTTDIVDVLCDESWAGVSAQLRVTLV
jgi:hypothetical protein